MDRNNVMNHLKETCERAEKIDGKLVQIDEVMPTIIGLGKNQEDGELRCCPGVSIEMTDLKTMEKMTIVIGGDDPKTLAATLLIAMGDAQEIHNEMPK